MGYLDVFVVTYLESGSGTELTITTVPDSQANTLIHLSIVL